MTLFRTHGSYRCIFDKQRLFCLMRQKSTARAILPLALHDRLKWSYDTSEMHDKVETLDLLI